MYRLYSIAIGVALAAAAFLCVPASGYADCGEELAKLLPDDGASGDGFGRSVSVSGDVAVIGASGDDDNGFASGSAYVLRWDGAEWRAERKVLPDDGAPEDSFGGSVSVSGDVIVIGAPGDDDSGDHSGSAYVFRRDGAEWVQAQKLLADDGAAGDYFGESVSVSGDVVVIGARWDDDNGDNSGSAYVFRWDGDVWLQEQKLLADDGASGDQFGFSVSVSGDVAAIGARLDDDNGDKSGSAYVFRWDGDVWLQEQKLLPDDGAPGDVFGYSASVSGDVAVIGAFWDGDNGAYAGSAYLFRWDGAAWRQQQKLRANDGARNDEFGYSVSVSGDVAVIGAHRDNDNGDRSGSAYVFRRYGTRWLQEQKVLPDDGAYEDYFGRSVSVSGDVTVIAAFRDDDNGDDSGSAYVFDLGDCQDCRGPIFKILADDGAEGDFFGYSVAIAGSKAVVGAPNDEHNGVYSGSAYVLDTVTGQQLFKMLPKDASNNLDFGSRMAADGDIVVIGVPRSNDNGQNSGSAYLFDTATGEQIARLVPDDGASQDEFGHSVAIHGTTMIVGARSDEDYGPDAGSAYLFDTTTGEQIAKLLPDDGAPNHEFGYSVAISDEYALVGAFGDGANGAHSGAAYLFDLSTGQQVARITPEDGETRDVFGVAVAMDGSIAIIGATGDDDNGEASGSAYLFDVVTREQLFKFVPDDGAANEAFGSAVAIDGATALIGVQRDGDNGENSGSAYQFDTTTGEQVAKILPVDGTTWALFGRSLAVSGATAIIGALGDSDNGEAAGSAYIFDLAQCDSCTREPEWQCDGDVDGDGQVNPVDSGVVQANFGNANEQALCNYDLDCDGQINPVDSGIVQSRFGTCDVPRDVCP